MILFDLSNRSTFLAKTTQKMTIAPTPPGYCIDGQRFQVMFVSGHQKELGWHNAEYVIGWKTVMKTIMSVFETYIR